jgi:CBS domain-containing protein
MKVRQVIERKTGPVITIDAAATAHAAIRKLNEHRIGALVVTGPDGTIAGILSERDILRECGTRCDRLPEGIQSLEVVGPALVREIMTEDVITASLEDDLTGVMVVMTDNRIRHLPIVEDGNLVGMISIGDAVKACVDMAEAENRALKEYIQGTTY